MTRRKIHVSRLLLLCSLAGMSLIVMAAGSGCIPMTGTGTDCDQLVDDYIAKLQEAMVMMQSVQSEADLDDIREVFCEAVDIAEKLLEALKHRKKLCRKMEAMREAHSRDWEKKVLTVNEKWMMADKKQGG